MPILIVIFMLWILIWITILLFLKLSENFFLFATVLFTFFGLFISEKVATFKANAHLDDESVKINFKFKTYVIPYAEIKSVRHYSFKGNIGVIIKTGFFKKLDIRGSISEIKGLDKFVAALKKKVR